MLLRLHLHVWELLLESVLEELTLLSEEPPPEVICLAVSQAQDEMGHCIFLSCLSSVGSLKKKKQL